ncbi:uncharacterized protein LOC129199533 isoform X1 [Grus americana]|uniref:uncharacterized protein LOC129199533 isoform X1 n=1 Tax=Grus americana TaxID=9117 RepID=UPI002407E4F9|nr:uncharacterized protein LOC129199533 isoform X1 [Grus americana]
MMHWQMRILHLYPLWKNLSSPFHVDKAFRVQPCVGGMRSSGLLWWGMSPQCLRCCNTMPVTWPQAHYTYIHLFKGPASLLPSGLHRGLVLCSQRQPLWHLECWLQIAPLVCSEVHTRGQGSCWFLSGSVPQAGQVQRRGGLQGCFALSRCAVGRSPEGRWELLPSSSVPCPQLNITAWSAQDGGFLEMQRLRLSSSVTEHSLPGHSPGSSYVVTMQGVTNTGAGAASLWEFQTDSSDTPHPLDISCRSVRDISPSQGTVVLPLRPIARPPEMAREHQLIVVATHNGTAVEGACLGEPQPFNASQQPGTYVAAVINLTASTDFVLGDGTRRQGYHNAALRTGWDYTALLRLVRRSPQAEKFTCVCYSFSVGKGSFFPAKLQRIIKKVKVARLEISHSSPCPGPQETFRAVREQRRWGG